ncbi:hypothetical protein BsWGS_27293 [Bradybaena similaris]
MASAFKRSSVDVDRRRPLVRSKQPNESLLKPSARKILMSLSQMSPEAQRAMKMTQEDTKEDMSNTENIKPDLKNFNIHDQSRGMSSSSVEHNVQLTDTGRDSSSCSRLFARPPDVHIRMHPRSRRILASSFGTSIQTDTSRSRSTLSITERNSSIIDKTDSCCNYNNTDKINRPNHRNSFHNKDNDSVTNKDNSNTGSNPTRSQHIEVLVQTSADVSNNNNISEFNSSNELHKEEHVKRPESFVLALDRALEDNCISRLSGDITNTAGISELGKVRALDGGRLTNAQEVVVNVRYDDDSELVFHDDDEENLNNAKATSNIRINLWMEYNEGFQTEDIVDDVEIIAANDNEAKTSQATDAAPCGDPASSLSQPRDRHVNRLSSNKANAPSNNSSKSKCPATKKDLNNNKTTCKLKINNVKNTKNGSSSRS